MKAVFICDGSVSCLSDALARHTCEAKLPFCSDWFDSPDGPVQVLHFSEDRGPITFRVNGQRVKVPPHQFAVRNGDRIEASDE